MATKGKKVEFYYTSQGTSTGIDASALLFDGKNLTINTHGKTFKGTDTWNALSNATDGYVPKAADGVDSTDASTYYFLGYSGTTVNWFKLPDNAFNDSTYTVNNATYSIRSKVEDDVSILSTFTSNQDTDSSFTIIQGTNVTLTSDVTNKTLTISSKDTNTWTAASTSEAGYIPKLVTGGSNIASSSLEYVLSYKSGTDLTPTWKLLPANAFKNDNDNTWQAANASQEGYVPKTTASKILRTDANGIVYWGDDSDTHYATSIAVGTSATAGNNTATDPYIKIFDDNTYKSQIQLKAGTGISIGSDTNGVVTIASTGSSSDVKTKQTDNNENADRPILLKYGTGTGEVTNGTLFADGVTVNPSTNSLSISGNLSVTGTASFSNNVTTSTKFHSSSSATTDITTIPSDSGIALETGDGGGGVSTWVWREQYAPSNWGMFHDNNTNDVIFVGNSTERVRIALGSTSLKVGGNEVITTGNISSHIGTIDSNCKITGYLNFNDHGYLQSGRSSSFNYGYSLSIGDSANSMGMFSGPGGEEGAVIVTPDTCIVYNSSDAGYNFACYDKDRGGDLTTSNSLLFAVRQDTYCWSRGGFIKEGSSDSYVLLGGGGHKAVSDFSTGSVSWSNVSGGRAYLPENTAHYFRDPGNGSWRGGLYWGSAGNESMSFIVVNSSTRFQFVCGSDIAGWGSSTWSSASPALTITSGSSTFSGAVYSNSDRHLKTHIQDIDRRSLDSLFDVSDKLLKKFTWKSTHKDSYGFIAQQVEKYIPEAVNVEPNGIKSVTYEVAYAKIISSMIKRIKELESVVYKNGQYN